MRPSAHNRNLNGFAPYAPIVPTAVVWEEIQGVCPRKQRGDNVEKRHDISKQSTGGKPAHAFDQFNLLPELRKAVVSAGYDEPRPIQVEAIPAALKGRDVLGLAQTGTGKTAAFVLPILQHLLNGRRGPHGARALVVAPTRELAAQVHLEFERLARYTPLTSTPIFGGVPIARQARALAKRPDVIVACPGRLLDLMNQGRLKLNGVEVLVLDEADHMFDMGFLPDVRRIMNAIPPRRQNLMFSATMPPVIRKLADTVLHKPAVIELANARPAETIEHALYPVNEGDKIGALERLLDGDEFRSAIVFMRTKRRVKKLAQRLDKRGLSAVAMEGNMSQPQRERALKGFRQGNFSVLVATDIAARGLDIAGVSHVINFDVPNTPDAYTHRIGRTGRSEQTGTAFTFVTHDDAKEIRAIEQRLGAPIERRQLDDLGNIERGTLDVPKKGRGGRGQRAGTQGGGSRAQTTARPWKQARPNNNGGRPRLSFARTAQPVTATASAPENTAAFGLGVGNEGERKYSPKKSETKGGKRRRRRRQA